MNYRHRAAPGVDQLAVTVNQAFEPVLATTLIRER